MKIASPPNISILNLFIIYIFNNQNKTCKKVTFYFSVPLNGKYWAFYSKEVKVGSVRWVCFDVYLFVYQNCLNSRNFLVAFKKYLLNLLEIPSKTMTTIEVVSLVFKLVKEDKYDDKDVKYLKCLLNKLDHIESHVYENAILPRLMDAINRIGQL